jgi:hypothetical protein
MVIKAIVRTDLDKEVSFIGLCKLRELVEPSLGLALDQSTKRDCDRMNLFGTIGVIFPMICEWMILLANCVGAIGGKTLFGYSGRGKRAPTGVEK